MLRTHHVHIPLPVLALRENVGHFFIYLLAYVLAIC